MTTTTVVSLDQIRAALESNTTNAHAEVMALLEKPLLEETLIKTRGNQTKAAELLGLNRGTLRQRLKAHNILKTKVAA
ncbi:protein ninH [Acinetobacter pittii]|jgi:Fis family transcriptional regulator|uniref:helix-turn-helix domain-containing protein n=1 Tax=Acinetobacter calcoaceticus/baumannii complex TaxID=909768 RepID=UPI0002BC003A|nr:MULTISPECIES: helix-turn-helix domain-containing protein [Acinetobacter calcoaceticus/baumannii complex]EXS21830.1 bacterial regulatory, Fis family protein [Acinetobacter baumannii 573719]AUT34491.1 protein ninH [Acinetobacter pittii]AXX40835.1 protein ninH [Acinetobacter baumannii]EHU1602123.1 protein ninH [Acinetobacter baumannii]EHU2403769.1 protein ninH [Acinetobacter baumannii]